jgi:hypothetical protein
LLGWLFVTVADVSHTLPHFFSSTGQQCSVVSTEVIYALEFTLLVVSCILFITTFMTYSVTIHPILLPEIVMNKDYTGETVIVKFLLIQN